MAKPTDYDKTHLRNMAAIGTRIDRIFKKAAEEAAKIGVSIKTPLPEDKIFSFEDYPETQKQIDRLMTALKQTMETTIVNGVQSAWTLSNNKNNDLVSRIFGDSVKDLSKEQYKRYFSTNSAALEAFLQRQTQGLNLSDRVWKYTNAFKREIELGLDLGIRTGEGAAQMTRSLRQYLQHPDMLFRRVRDEHGNLKLSQAAKDFHPGRGVYRSSYKNARRLACTEINIAYRTSDHLRWQQMDFIVGMEVKLSNNHTINGVPLTDICDTLKGRYPKDFKFTGWHPHCRCHVIPVVKTEEEMAEDTQRILSGERPTKGSENTVSDVPGNFKSWVIEHADKIDMGGSLPYFIKDNQKTVSRIIGMGDDPRFATIVKVGNTNYTLKQLISECQIVEVENGKIYLHPEHGKNELTDNLEFARWRAEMFGEEVILLPNPQGVKSADSYNITRGVLEEYKQANMPTINAVSQLIRSGKNQAAYIIIEPHPDMLAEKMMKALTSRISDGENPRCPNLKEIRIKIGDCEAVYTRFQITSEGFKIKPRDFHNVSASRSQGSSLTSKEAGSISDAKLQQFFGLNKKTSAEIVAERRAMRDDVAIQQAWNKRRIANIQKAVNNGLLPKEVMEGLSSLPQEQLNERIAYLRQRATAHSSRTPDEIQKIKDAWAAKLKRDENTKLMANNVLKVAQDWQEVDFSTLQKLIADGNLTKMREEAKKVAQVIKTMHDEEKALADLIPDVHGWHKQFSLAELKAVKTSVEKQLANFKVKGYGDFALDTDLANLQVLKNSLVYQANLAVKNQAKYATWEVAQQSWLKLADKAQDLIDLHPIKAKLTTLQGFETKSKKFKELLDKAQAAATAGNKKMAQFYTQEAEFKMNNLESKRKDKSVVISTSAQFGDEAYTKSRKDAAMWAKDTDEADSRLRSKCGEVWQSLSKAERDAIHGYTGSYHNINEPLRGLTYYGSERDRELGLKRIPHIESVIDKSSYDFDMWLQRGDDMIALKKFGLTNWKNPTDEEIMALLGAEGVEGAFWSAGVAKGKGFADRKIIFNIYAPKGTKAMYCEPFSAYGKGSGRKWDGISEQSSFGDESEILIQRGTKYKITKIEKTNDTWSDKWYIDVDIIEQNPVTFPYVGGYPFK